MQSHFPVLANFGQTSCSYLKQNCQFIPITQQTIHTRSSTTSNVPKILKNPLFFALLLSKIWQKLIDLRPKIIQRLKSYLKKDQKICTLVFVYFYMKILIKR